MFNQSDRFAKLHVASPCTVGWNQMSGDDRVRFCEHCQLHVYNISELTRRQVTDLIDSNEGRLCGRLFRRSDGTVMVRDCPIGLQAIKRRLSRTAAAIFAITGSCVSLVAGQTSPQKSKSCRSQTQIVRKEVRSNEHSSIISGTLFDINGAVITNAIVRLLNVQTKELRQVDSDSEGQFRFIGLGPGEYSINVQANGFKTYGYTGFNLEKREAADVSITLLVSEETVLVGILGDTSHEDEPGVKTFKQDYLLKLPLP